MRLDRLVDQFSSSWRPVIVAAVDGSGKRQLAAAVARSFDAQIVSIGADGWIEAIGSDEPAVLVERSLPAVDPDIDRDLADALELRTSDQPLLASARRFGPRVRALQSRQVIAAMTERDLWFSQDDVELLAKERDGTAETAGLIHELTNGWPQLIWDLQGFDFTWNEANGLRLATELRNLLKRQMAAMQQDLAPEHVDVLTTLAFLDAFNTDTIEQLGTTATLHDLAEAGLPLLETGGGWSVLPTVVRSWLQRNAAAPPIIPDAVLDQLADQGRSLEAIESALNCGQTMQAAEILSRFTMDQTISMDAARVIAAIDRLGDARDAHPRTYLVHAEVILGRGDWPTAAELIETGIQVLARSGDGDNDRLNEELQVELALVHYLIGDLDAARALLPGAPTEFSSPVARARQFEVQAGIDALSMTEQGLTSARAGYRRAREAWLECGQVGMATYTQVRNALEVVQQLGYLEEAAQLLSETLSTTASNVMRANVTRLFHARTLALLGDQDAATEAIISSAPITRALQMSLMQVYELNARLILISQQSQTEDVVALENEIRDADNHIMDTATGALLLADWIDAYIRCGSRTNAERCLAEVLDHASAEPADTQTSAALVACHLGDARDGLELVAKVEASGLMVPRGRWRIHLAGAVANARLGQSDAAATAIAAAQLDAERLGTPSVMARGEAALIRSAKGEAPRAADEPVPVRKLARCDVRLFGQFEVLVDGVAARLHSGRPQTLLKVLILEGGYITVDQATDLLWPDDDPAKGRRRLRNTLTRLRSSLGPVINRDAELLRLDPAEISSDFGHWQQQTEAARQGTGPALIALINTAPGELLPGDRYEEWAQTHRQNHQMLMLRLIDRQTQAAIDAGDLDTALSMYHRALDTDPFSIDRLDAGLALARAHGMADAADVLERRRPPD